MRFSLGHRAPKPAQNVEEAQGSGQVEDYGLQHHLNIQESKESADLRLNLKIIRTSEHTKGNPDYADFTDRNAQQPFQTERSNGSNDSRMSATVKKMSNLYEHDKKMASARPKKHLFHALKSPSRSLSPRTTLRGRLTAKRDEVENLLEASPAPLGISALQSSRFSAQPDDGTPKAYIPDRKPTIYETASVNFIGVKEQRPAELLKMELQIQENARSSFYQSLQDCRLQFDELDRSVQQFE